MIRDPMKFLLITSILALICPLSIQAMSTTHNKVVTISADLRYIFAFSGISQTQGLVDPATWAYYRALHFINPINKAVRYLDMTQSQSNKCIDYFIKITNPQIIINIAYANPHLLSIKNIQKILLRLCIDKTLMAKVLPLVSDATLFSCLKRNPNLKFYRAIENRCLANRKFSFLKALYVQYLSDDQLKKLLRTFPYLVHNLEVQKEILKMENHQYYLPIIRKSMSTH